MANTVEIIIKAIDQASATISKATSGIGKLASGFQSLTGFSLGAAGGIAAAGLALGKIVKFTKDAINETVDYAQSMKDMSVLIGLSVGETSRLVQASDDLFLSQEKLKTALIAASRQGIDVSIKGLKELSAEYLSINDATQRSEFLLKTFGRSGAEMYKLMEMGAEGLQDAMEKVDPSLIINEQDYKNVKEYKIALDNATDAMTGLKTQAGLVMLPKFAEGAQDIADMIANIKKYADFMSGVGLFTNKQIVKWINAQNTSVKDTTDSYDAYLDATHDVILSQGWVVDGYGRVVTTTGKVIEGVNIMTEAQYDLYKATNQVTPEIEDEADAIDEAASNIEEFSNKVLELDNIDTTFGDKIIAEFEKLKFYEAGGGELQGAAQKLSDLMETGIGSENVESIVNELFIGQQAAAVEAGTLSAYAAKTAIVQTLGLTWQEATAQFNAWLSNMSGKTINITARIAYTGMGFNSSADAANALKELAQGVDLNGNDIIGREGGGPVWSNKPYLVGEKGPEIIVPATNGSVIPNNKLGGSAINFYGDAYFDIKNEDIAENLLLNMPVRI